MASVCQRVLYKEIMHRFFGHITLVCFLAFAILAHFEVSEGNAVPALETGIEVAELQLAADSHEAGSDKPCSCEQHGNKMTSLTCGVVLALLGASAKSDLSNGVRQNFEWFNNSGARLFSTPPKKPPRFIL